MSTKEWESDGVRVGVSRQRSDRFNVQASVHGEILYRASYYTAKDATACYLRKKVVAERLASRMRGVKYAVSELKN